jgi:splicing factor 3B subunit 1
MKKIVLKVVKQCAGTEGVLPSYVKNDILPEFFKHFFVRRMAMDRRNYKQVVETTVELAQKAGVSTIVERVVDGLKDENEPFRKMVMETIQRVVSGLGAADIDEDQVMLDGVGTVVNALGGFFLVMVHISSDAVWFRIENQAISHSNHIYHLVAFEQ